ncbi:bifunctional diaminohydroxyphosphoribosylaminopyrimidine deaminase/5-amino-6-(5-phosphoribosylamino)uracil reductase RibD [Desulfovibrio sp. PG-178-WT-4]|uniref:Riboflavin biosynthesis protein RibD n=1 Tax=Desulfovibrio porci TaxID=2605782 RepID=A0A6L5XHK8_9BACT|nr:bifunctional diaminohydroxyphosphoribosylaminopyrimidine deaminase/5-amino-6-(5-phosphoribosylamino)uracil reductase RibD [Desulfovibrio porci]MSS26693.1 bifunctional diaminohydroxyphosphoribosylaminopyrimidine deaminase/5-amino-6-(5-phosphoribosylamino)uracil reductase RibD [Desulfovibrio porci]
MTEQDFAPFMREAIALAEQGRWKACPNPTVGAVLLRDGQIVARGWHHEAGQDHAEVDCLKDAAAHGVNPKGCTLVVTLEPCNHQGKTPPCTQAILDAGVSRVVMGLADPNPLAAGGAARLREAGVEVLGPVCETECRDLVADFLVWQSTDRPYLILKMAATLDGRIATRNGHSQWITCEASRREVQDLRAGLGLCGGAVLVGGGTFRADNPLLTARGGCADAPQPLACLLTSRLPKPDADFHLLKERPEQTVFLASPAVAASTAAQALRQIGARVLALGPGPHGGPDFREMFRALRQDLGCPYVLCEGGGRLALALLEAGFVDEFRLHLAPLVLGDNEARPLFAGRAPQSLSEALRLRISRTSLCGDDIHILLRPLAADDAGQGE